MGSAAPQVLDRLELISVEGAVPIPSFAEDVRCGLEAEPKCLPSKYFYDQIGSALFDTITLLPEYYLTRAETAILREWGWEIVRALDGPIEFLELGSGSAIKTRILIEEALRAQGSLRYNAIDISAETLRASASALVAAYPKLSVTAYAGDYFAILGRSALRRTHRVLAMFMGSNIGNYAPGQARRLLGGIASSLKPRDGLLLGVDLKKDPRVLQAAYDDAIGVTAAFNKNLLARINRELGGTFDLAGFAHIARYEPEQSRVASYLESLQAQSVCIETLDLTVAFARNERMHTESSYKFSVDDIMRLAEATGFTLSRSWSDKDQRFGVYLLLRNT